MGTASVTEDWNSGPLPSGASSLGQKSANTDLDATSRGRLSDMCTQQNRSGPSTSFLKTVVIKKKKKKKKNLPWNGLQAALVKTPAASV